jgi:hypothetical protein
VVDFPALDLGLGADRGVKTAAQQKAMVSSFSAAQVIAFGALTRAAVSKIKHHAPATVQPIVFSAGGALRECDDVLLPCPEGRNGRHWVRVEISSILLKYAYKISCQFWSRRGISVVASA